MTPIFKKPVVAPAAIFQNRRKRRAVFEVAGDHVVYPVRYSTPTRRYLTLTAGDALPPNMRGTMNKLEEREVMDAPRIRTERKTSD